MLDTKTRFKLDIVIEDEVIIRKAPQAIVDLDASSKKDAEKKVQPVEVSKELLTRIIERVERI